jgi:PAS domain S-box-containing protein
MHELVVIYTVESIAHSENTPNGIVLNMNETARQESLENFKRLFMYNPEAAIYMDSNFHILDVNPRFTELFGYTLEEVKGKHIDDVIVPKDKLEEGEMLDRKALKGYINYDTVRMKKDGFLIHVSVSATPIIVDGQNVGYMGVYRDITETKRYEERLSALNDHSRRLNTAESMDEIYQLTMVAVEKTLGFEIAFFMIVDNEMLRVVDHRGYPDSFAVRLPLDGTKKGISVEVARTGRSINVPDAEKEEAWVEFMPGIRSGLDVPVKIGHRVLGVIGVDSKKLNAFNEKDQELLEILASHAATAMSNLEYARSLEAYARKIRESQQKFERLFMDNPEGAVHLDSNFHILDVNPSFMRLFGYYLDEVKGKHINDVIVPSEKMDEAVAYDEKASRGETHHEDTVRKRKDGSLVPVAFSAAPIIVENQTMGYIAVYKDISQLKKAEEELRQTLEKLAKINEKLRVVGGLTRHDARNKLCAITGNVYVVKKKLTNNNEVLGNLKEMEVAAQQMVRIFDFAKTYEMLGVEEVRYIEVEKMINEAVSLFSDLANIKVINNCVGLTVLADSLLRQLFYNLVDNSLKYGEKIKTITARYEETDDDKLRLIYSDDGVGIAEEEKKSLFQEGYGRGTGYGLYLIKKMCEGYHWDIQETSKQGQGAEFTITIPRFGKKGERNYKIR